MNELKVFSGNAHPVLAGAVCEYLGIPLGESEVFKFTNDNIFVRRLDENDLGMARSNYLRAPLLRHVTQQLICLSLSKNFQVRVRFI